jgi:hypothetical protein
MTIFKTFTLRWWQIPLVKICLISLGIILGLYLKDYLIDYVVWFWALFAVTAVYFIYIWLEQ